MDKSWRKDTALFLVSQTLSLFGSSLVQYAIVWYITLQTKSGLVMMIYILCGFVPTFFMSFFAGVWADRYSRKLLIALSDSAIALSTLLLAILYYGGYEALWLLFVISSVRALGAGVQTPAVNAFIPQLVPVDKLTRVNAINGSIQSAIMIVSPMVSGALLMVADIKTIFLIDVITAAIGVFVLLFKVPAREKPEADHKSSYFEDMRLGFMYIKNHGFVKRFFVFCIFFLFMISPAAFLTPIQVARNYGSEYFYLTAIEIAFASGMLGGGFIMSAWGGFKNRVHTMAASTLLISFSTLLLGFPLDFKLYILVMALAGLSIPFFNTPSVVLIQEKVEDDYLGRIFGVFGMISSSVMPLGMLVFGPAADVVKIEYLLIGTGVLLFAEGLLLFASKTMREAGAVKKQTQ
ncbi:MAG: enterobactin exporter EntS [Firmicutes bacterium ADurb.Bin193]|nr:MAG: enterobactin exporter EntS [Firmicutes bacterium ADurb.Bin193]